MRRINNTEIDQAKPFFKWAGGKTQLLPEFTIRLPSDLLNGNLTRYVEPFIGGGAVYFYLLQLFPFKESYICDVNEELILTYQVVQKDVHALISLLSEYQERYDTLDESGRSQEYYNIRDNLNINHEGFDYFTYSNDWIERAAQLLFLNKTCYNGLFRLNSKGGFNVPFGRYKNPRIINESNLLKAHKLLSKTTILKGDFSICQEYIDEETFVYIDPPYRPLNQTSSFTSYSQGGFSEQDQIRLSKFFADIDRIGAKVMLSNSDPKNEDPSDHFFDDLYQDFTIERVLAKRSINSMGNKRGEIKEIIVMNYIPPEQNATG
jgi:DNA adenine methylase